MKSRFSSLSLLTWYQSQGRKPNSFQFPRVINSGKPSCDRVSFRPPSPDPKAFRSVESSSENIHRRRLFRRRLFPTPQGAPGGDLQFFPKHRSQKTTHAHFSGRRLHLTLRRVSHFLATRFLLQPRLMPTSHPSYMFLPSEPCTCLFWGSFASAGPPNNFSGVLRLFFLNPNPCTCLGKCSSTFPVVPRLFFFSIWSLTRVILRFFLLRPHLKPY